eukprot:TRINITY_DN4296_c1_g1_i2.p1 TRINITY_DN4296_c1_g1~~TRINITY_DN4296_c1_g1_i2.p1  ORF type:complete len:445 (-),score=234.30 TRINITY_DN4296_c1_g1_i2:143-1477(-)
MSEVQEEVKVEEEQQQEEEVVVEENGEGDENKEEEGEASASNNNNNEDDEEEEEGEIIDTNILDDENDEDEDGKKDGPPKKAPLPPGMGGPPVKAPLPPKKTGPPPTPSRDGRGIVSHASIAPVNVDKDTWSSRPVSNRVWEVDEEEDIYDDEEPLTFDLSGSVVENDFDINTKKVLGRGYYSTVVEATDKSTNSKVALKVVNKDLVPNAAEDGYKTEKEILDLVESDHVVKCVKFYDLEEYFVLVLELLDSDFHTTMLNSNEPYTEATAHRYIVASAEALAHVHSKGVLHGDISPENLVFKGDSLKLIGFCSSKLTDGNESGMLIGNAEYQPPELQKNESFGLGVDIWGLGCLMYFFISGNSPFNDQNDMRMKMKIRQAKFTFPEDVWGNVAPSLIDLIKNCLQPDQKDRISASDILSSDFIKNGGNANCVLDNFKASLRSDD